MFDDTRFLIRVLFKTSPSDVENLIPKKMESYPFSGYKYMSWCGYLIYHNDKYANVSEVDYNHESIHLAQERDEGSWVRYYLKYFWEWLSANPLTKTDCCYACSIYEAEAYSKEADLDYLSRRETHAERKFVIENKKDWWSSLRCRYKDALKAKFADL